MDPARAGMGAAKQNIRRLSNMGAIQQSANTLDMAITGAMGLFLLTGNVDDPSQTYYTRNGQFAISKEVDPSYPKRSYIVNENGMFLTGYTSTDGKELSNTHTHRLSMPPVSLDPVTTENSVVSVTLDARKTAFIPEANSNLILRFLRHTTIRYRRRFTTWETLAILTPWNFIIEGSRIKI